MKLLRVGGLILVEWLLRQGLKLITEYLDQGDGGCKLHHFRKYLNYLPQKLEPLRRLDQT
jgi:hypothetical protein